MKSLRRDWSAVTWIAAFVVAMPMAMARPSTSNVDNLLTNSGFEAGTHKATAYWTPAGGPYHDQFNEVNPPEGWTAWWYEGFPCATAYTFDTGRPEILTFTDPGRVHSGTKAVKAFTFWRCHEMGLFQKVDVVTGTYVFTVYAHSWYSNCSNKPFDPPLDSDCQTPLAAWNKLKVGIDSGGDIDPHGSSVHWGATIEQYGVYGQQPLAVIASVPMSGTVTVFVSSLADNPLKHADVYLDDAALWRVEYSVFLPLAQK